MNSLHPMTLATSLVSPGGARGRLSILIYHRVLETPDPLLPSVPDTTRFRWQMSLLSRHFNVLPLGEAVRRLKEGTLPARAACITFDDGYADNYTTALPILESAGLPATIFIATAYLDGGRMFNDTLIELARRIPDGEHDIRVGDDEQRIRIQGIQDRRALIDRLIKSFKYRDPATRLPEAEGLDRALGVSLPDDLMLSTDQLRAFHRSSGIEIGGHTHSHPILAQMSDMDAEAEIRAGKENLENLLQAPIRAFAYPNGRPVRDYTAAHAESVKRCGFEFALTTHPSAATASDDLYELPRYAPWEANPIGFTLRMLRTLAAAR